MSQPAHQLVGLPVYGETAAVFSANGMGLHTEGVVVEFLAGDSTRWIGNFIRGLSSFDFVGAHPDLRRSIVIAGGQGHVVDRDTRVVEYFGGAIVGVFEHPQREWLVFNHQDISFTALGATGWAWKSRRVSWDGLRSLAIEGEILRGEAWAPGDSWEAFELDLNTGDVNGGSYPASP